MCVCVGQALLRESLQRRGRVGEVLQWSLREEEEEGGREEGGEREEGVSSAFPLAFLFALGFFFPRPRRKRPVPRVPVPKAAARALFFIFLPDLPDLPSVLVSSFSFSFSPSFLFAFFFLFLLSFLGYAHFLFLAAVSFVVCVISFVYSLANN
jgi:hypothetical protein